MNQAIEQACASGEEQIAQLTNQQSADLIQAALSDGRLFAGAKRMGGGVGQIQPRQTP